MPAAAFTAAAVLDLIIVGRASSNLIVNKTVVDGQSARQIEGVAARACLPSVEPPPKFSRTL